jgi:hypothetical protein
MAPMGLLVNRNSILAWRVHRVPTQRRLNELDDAGLIS